ncbi:MAG: hypothetical protein JRG94_15690 [Deltaproteobacteria bacterium]|nr:hypothetical protein [Deltaproteobacteria bacterium]
MQVRLSQQLVALTCAASVFPALLLLLSLAPALASEPEVRDRACPEFASGESRGRIASNQIKEASGIAASHRNPGVYYVHNDSGDRARIFAIDETGRDLGTYLLAGARHSDWEDIAVGPAMGEPGTFVYVADIGDNERRRRWVTVYRVPEPEISLARTGGTHSLTGGLALRMRYPGATAHDAETLLVDPESSDLFIVTKETRGQSRVFRYPAPHRPKELVTLEEVGALQLGPSDIPAGKWVTGGDISLRRNQIVGIAARGSRSARRSQSRRARCHSAASPRARRSAGVSTNLATSR